jgi:hypothetical protein
VDERKKQNTYPLDMLMENMPAVQLLKLDVQGSEILVLKGAKVLLRSVEVLFITVSLMKLHKNAPLALEVLTYCRSLGFELINYVGGDMKGNYGALATIELTLLKHNSPLFDKVSEGITLPDEYFNDALSANEDRES